MIYKNFQIAVIIILILTSCSNSRKYKIEKGRVGYLTSKTTIKELSDVFKNDSIVKNLSEGVKGSNYFEEDDEYYIYEKRSKKLLLTIMPEDPLDETSIIKSVEIHDERFITEKGITLNSNFLEINANCDINKIERSLSSAMLSLKDLNATVTIGNDELGLRDFSTSEVTKDRIPDSAKIKTFIVWFNSE